MKHFLHERSVENNEEIANVYREFFAEDKVIITDAHQYLLDHFKEFDFIWSSPPCPTHSRLRSIGVKAGNFKPLYPDMDLYQEIIFLKHFCNVPWVIENVRSYYKPLIKPNECGRHYFWNNFYINNKKLPIELPQTRNGKVINFSKTDKYKLMENLGMTGIKNIYMTLFIYPLFKKPEFMKFN